MDIKNFVGVATSLPANISTLIRGNHGIGKSEVVHQIAEKLGLELIDRRMSQMTEGDVIGLPKLEDGVTKFIPAEFIKIACTRPVMLFLDEINRATQEVMQACFQLCLDRELNGNKLHPMTRVFAAVNSSAMYQVNEMDPAFLDRFFVVDLTPTAQDWFDWAETEGGIDADLVRFLKERETRLEPSEANPGSVQPSRRSWARLDRTFKANKIYEDQIAAIEKGGNANASQGRAYNFAIGFVGVEASIELCDFLSKRETRFTAVNILREYPKHQAKVRKLGQDKLNTLIDMIVEHAKVNVVTIEDAQNLATFVTDLPGELRVSFITNYTKGTRQTALFSQNFKTINSTVMPHIVSVFNDKKQMDATLGTDTKKKK
jgi:MoxR-like ATPase